MEFSGSDGEMTWSSALSLMVMSSRCLRKQPIGHTWSEDLSDTCRSTQQFTSRGFLSVKWCLHSCMVLDRLWWVVLLALRSWSMTSLALLCQHLPPPSPFKLLLLSLCQPETKLWWCSKYDYACALLLCQWAAGAPSQPGLLAEWALQRRILRWLQPHNHIPGEHHPPWLLLWLVEAPTCTGTFEHEPTTMLNLGTKFYYELRVKLLLCHRKKLPPFFRVPLFI